MKIILSLPTVALISSAVMLAVAPLPKTMPLAPTGKPLIADAVKPAVPQAAASTDKSQFFPDGIALTMEPADLSAIATTMPRNQLPPAQFDHAVSGPVEIVDVATEDRLRALCGWPASKGETLVGCAAVLPTLCRIYVGPPAGGVTRNLIIRHEMGHCSGWPKDHSTPQRKGHLSNSPLMPEAARRAMRV